MSNTKDQQSQSPQERLTISMKMENECGELVEYPMFSVDRFGFPVRFDEPDKLFLLVMPLIRMMADDPKYRAELERLGMTIEASEPAEHETERLAQLAAPKDDVN